MAATHPGVKLLAGAAALAASRASFAFATRCVVETFLTERVEPKPEFDHAWEKNPIYVSTEALARGYL